MESVPIIIITSPLLASGVGGKSPQPAMKRIRTVRITISLFITTPPAHSNPELIYKMLNFEITDLLFLVLIPYLLPREEFGTVLFKVLQSKVAG